MKQITLHIKDGKFQAFMHLVHMLDFVHAEEDEGDSREDIMHNIKQGKLQTISAKCFLNELRSKNC